MNAEWIQNIENFQLEEYGGLLRERVTLLWR